jgi:hypothetical protein
MRKIKGVRVSDTQAGLYDLLKKYGPMPDHALVPMAQHMMPTHPSSSGIRTRRRELQLLGLVIDTGKDVRTGSGRNAILFKAAK